MPNTSPNAEWLMDRPQRYQHSHHLIEYACIHYVINVTEFGFLAVDLNARPPAPNVIAKRDLDLLVLIGTVSRRVIHDIDFSDGPTGRTTL